MLFIRESFETPSRLDVGTPLWMNKILIDMERKALQVWGQLIKRSKMVGMHMRHKCGKLNEPV